MLRYLRVFLLGDFRLLHPPPPPPPEVVTIYARAFTWVLLGVVLLANRIGDHISVYLQPLIGDPLVAASFSWGSAVLAYLYRLATIPLDRSTFTVFFRGSPTFVVIFLVGQADFIVRMRISFILRAMTPFVSRVIGGDVFVSQPSHLINPLLRFDTTGRHA
ncbi:hypothetical protein LINPERPRIM_LOCUS40872 [Linum perenne]